jgi:glycosyltransferase involved in cell wall biosynthesis
MIVSVITVTRDRARLIGHTIRSVLAQTHTEFEYLILDDGFDDTESVVRGFDDERISYIKVSPPGHLSEVRQRGVDAARGDWVAFVDSDDLWLPNKLEAQLRQLEKTGADICAAGVTLFSERGEWSPYSAVLQEEPLDLFDLTIRRSIVLIYPSALLLKRGLPNALGGFDRSMKSGDHDMFTRIIASFPSTIVREPLVRIRRHPGNGSDQELVSAYEEHIVTLERLFARGRIDSLLLRERRGFDHYVAGSLLLREGRVIEARRHFSAALKDTRVRGVKAALKLLYTFVPSGRR